MAAQVLRQKLDQIENHISWTEQRITLQRSHLSKLQRVGGGTSSAEQFLHVLEDHLAIAFAHRDWLLRQPGSTTTIDLPASAKNSSPHKQGPLPSDCTRAAAGPSDLALPQSKQELRLVAKIGEVLARTLEFEDTLTYVAQLATDDLADLCVINFIDDNGVIERVRVYHRDSRKHSICDALMRMPPGDHQPRIARLVQETRQPVVIPEVTPEHIRSWSGTDEQLAAFKELNPKSVIVVPIMLQGTLLGAISLFSSIADRRYGPAQLHVAQAIADRAAFFLDNARLYRAAKRATEFRDEMLAVVAHDLRNPLAAIGALAAYLKASGKDAEAGEEIEHAVGRMNRLIQDLLDVNRLDAGKLAIELKPLSAREVVRDVLKEQMPLASSAGLELWNAMPPEHPDILADQHRLMQVFENLIGNAVKFTPPGGRVTVGAVTRNGAIEFFVSDTGRGIPADELPHVFDRFWQSPQGVSRGAGLGLTIVKGIVEVHGGRAWAQSQPGQGSTFYFTIPTASRSIAPCSFAHKLSSHDRPCALVQHNLQSH